MDTVLQLVMPIGMVLHSCASSWYAPPKTVDMRTLIKIHFIGSLLSTGTEEWTD